MIREKEKEWFLTPDQLKPMKQLFTLLIIVSSFTLSSCQEKMKKYDWIPTECAPVNYPAQIYKGALLYGEKGSIYIPDGRAINYGWGESGSVNIAGEQMKEVPHTLEISWLSFTEKKNYGGKFELDTKKIDSLFAAGYPDDSEEGGKGNYHSVKVGMAPGGDLVVWLAGSRSKQVEVGFFKAKPIENLDWKKIYPSMEDGIGAYIDVIVKKLPDSVKEQMAAGKIPFGYWGSLRKRYNWKPEIQTNAKVLRIDLDYFNKERDFVFGDALQHLSVKPNAVIEELSVYWLDDRNRELRTELKFDEQEAFSVFSKIPQGEEASLVVVLDKTKKDATVRLKIKDKETPFQQVKVQSFYK